MVIYPSQHDDPNTIFTLQLIKCLASLSADFALTVCQRFETHIESAFILFTAKPQHRTPCFEHLVGTDPLILEIQDWIDVGNAMLGKDIAFLHESGLYRLRSRGHSGTSI